MGMQGMDIAGMKAYAEPVKNAAKDTVASLSSKMTVAEFRNMINPVTKYYDWMDNKAFWKDKTLTLKEKITVIFGSFIGELLDESKLAEIAEKFNSGKEEIK